MAQRMTRRRVLGTAAGGIGRRRLGAVAARRFGLTALAVGVFTVCLTGTAGADAPRVSAAVTEAEASALGGEAFLYGYPLLEFSRVRSTMTSVRCPDSRGNAPINSFSTVTRFASPSTRTVVAPNVDALYSVAHLDLGKGPVTLSHPGMGRRYFVFQLLDPYTNNVAYVGTRTTGSRAGRFAISWSGRPGKRKRGVKIIRVKSRRIWVLGRTLATDRADQRRAIALMRRYTLSPPGGARRFSARCRPGEPHKATTPTGRAFLDRLGAALKQNPPPARDRALLARLARVGVGPGLRPERAGLSPATLKALVAGVETTAAGLPAGARSTVLANAIAHGGWATPPSDIGDYGVDYRNRAGVAVLGLGANTPIEALYPTAYTDAAGQLLDGRHDYRLVFAKGQVPPVHAFWSLTVYDNDGNLVANRSRRYAIGSSHLPLVRRSDGSVVVVTARTRPTERGANWLPTPRGRFRLNLRLYRPTARALRGVWQPPPIQRLGP